MNLSFLSLFNAYTFFDRSPIDPFENLPNLVSQDNGSERLIQSTES